MVCVPVYQLAPMFTSAEKWYGFGIFKTGDIGVLRVL